MYRILKNRIQQGQRTISFPASESILAQRYRGLPALDSEKCQSGCSECVDHCPTGAILQSNASGDANDLRIDLGKCLFCTECERFCPDDAIAFSKDYRLSVRQREALIVGDSEEFRLAGALQGKIQKLFGRSLKLRVVSAGGCNGCEVEVNALGNTVYDIGRFGIQIVASPRHADGLLITGPVTENMREALLKTYAAVPAPKLVIAVGACAISGGPFSDHPEVNNGVEGLIEVDLFVPGCPPHPLTIMDGLLRLLGKKAGGEQG